MICSNTIVAQTDILEVTTFIRTEAILRINEESHLIKISISEKCKWISAFSSGPQKPQQLILVSTFGGNFDLFSYFQIQILLSTSDILVA